MGPAALGSQNWGIAAAARALRAHLLAEMCFLPGTCPCKNRLHFVPALARAGSLRRMVSREVVSPTPKAFPLGVEQSGGLFGQVQAKPP